MTKQEAVAFYGSQDALAKTLGMAQSSIAEWGEYPPPLRQLHIEKVTKGKLRAERNVFEKSKAA